MIGGRKRLYALAVGEASGMNAIDLLDAMQTHLGVPWQSQRAGGDSDTVLAGDPATDIKGVITSWAPTVAVLRQAIASGHNAVVCRQSPFYSHGEAQPVAYRGGAAPAASLLEADPVYQGKAKLIKDNNLVVLRFSDNWDARTTDGQLAGLARAMGWDGFHMAVKGDKGFYRPGNNYFSLPPLTLGKLATGLAAKLEAPALRAMGPADATVRKAAVLPGLTLVRDLQEALAQPGVDLIVTGEVVEWEGAEYLQDAITAKRLKGALLLGSEVSEEPGSGEMATWLRTFLTLPVQWISSRSPFTPIH